jgi:hypothetical protein
MNPNMQISSIEKTDTSVKILFNNNNPDYKIIARIDDPNHYCCERFGVYTIGGNYRNVEDYVGKNVKDVNINYHYEDDDVDDDDDICTIKKIEVASKNYNDSNKQILLETSINKPSSIHVIITFHSESIVDTEEEPECDDFDELQLIVYNEHNGYYSHSCYIELNLQINEHLLKHSQLTYI